MNSTKVCSPSIPTWSDALIEVTEEISDSLKQNPPHTPCNVDCERLDCHCHSRSAKVQMQTKEFDACVTPDSLGQATTVQYYYSPH
jgi:hypothetical protein